MKKSLNVILVMLLVFVFTGCALAQTAYVTISDENGALVLANEAVEVTDVDEDGAVTVADVLYCAHEAAFEGGAEAGFATADTEYGLSLAKLWGVENGGSYGYYIDNAMAYSMADEVADGGYVNAYIYTDLETWSDTYCFFDEHSKDCAAGEAVELTLYAALFDENWNPVSAPLAGAAITINGEATEFVTDENGAVSVTLPEAGSYIISAVSADAVLVPPVCVVTAA